MERKSAAEPILAALLILAVPLAAYVAGYFWLGKRTFHGTTAVLIEFDARWQVILFGPAMRVEAAITAPDIISSFPAGESTFEWEMVGEQKHHYFFPPDP